MNDIAKRAFQLGVLLGDGTRLGRVRHLAFGILPRNFLRGSDILKLRQQVNAQTMQFGAQASSAVCVYGWTPHASYSPSAVTQLQQSKIAAHWPGSLPHRTLCTVSGRKGARAIFNLGGFAKNYLFSSGRGGISTFSAAQFDDIGLRVSQVKLGGDMFKEGTENNAVLAGYFVGKKTQTLRSEMGCRFANTSVLTIR